MCDILVMAPPLPVQRPGSARPPVPDGLDLVALVEAAGPRRPAAENVLRLLGEDRASARDVGRAIALDATLAARLLRVANSAYYGLSGRVVDLGRAVAVVGFRSVQALAASSLAGLDTSSVPPEFWEESTRVAVAAGLLARPLQALAPEAFSAGLLHDIGVAVLHQVDPAGAQQSAGLAPVVGTCEAERSVLGVDHTEVGSRLMSSWGFPPALVSAVAGHHVGLGGAPLDRVVRLAVLMAHGDVPAVEVARLSRGALTVSGLERMRDDVEDQARELAAALQS